MRATLTLDDDIAEALQEQALRLGKTFEQVVNDTLRRGLWNSPEEGQAPPASDEERPIFRVKPIAGGFAPGVDPLRLNQLYDQLEIEDFLREQERDRP